MKSHLSLFTGIGGIDLAAEWAGFESIAMVERDPFCQKVLAKHWPEVPIYNDVTTFDGSEFRGVDLISGGFPCQPHSLAGSRKASGDERDLWGEFRRLVGEARPTWVLAENVPGLFSSESGRFFGRIQNDLASLGYRVGWACYGASDTGAVHRRNRVFIVAYAAQLFSDGGGNQPKCAVSKSGNNRGSADATDADRRKSSEIPRDDAEVRGFQEEKREPEYGSALPGRNRFSPIRGGDWREWGISPTVRLEPRVRGSHDGTANRVDRLKALGNAVAPQQIYPILKAIAEAL